MKEIRICGLFLIASVLVLSLCARGSERPPGAASLSSLKAEEAGARDFLLLGTGPWVELAKLTASDGTQFSGDSVAIRSDTVVAVGSSKVRVFTKPAEGWADMTETATLTASDSAFLSTVAVSGNIVVAGAVNAAVYVFVKPKRGWRSMTETARLTASDWSWTFGASVATSGDTVVVGVPCSNWDCHGAAYVFVKPEGGWTDMTETAKVTASEPMYYGNLGASVAISGDTVVAGAPNSPYNHVGDAYVFVKPEGGWVNKTEDAILLPSDMPCGMGVGSSVAIKGDTMVAGALPRGICGNADPGVAYVFVKPPNGWAGMTETAKLSAPDGVSGDNFGVSVFFGGSRIVVGAPGTDIGSNLDQGAAYMFAKPKNGWKTTTKFNAKVTVPDGAAGDAFGSAVSISKGTVVVGAHDATGAAYVFGKQ